MPRSLDILALALIAFLRFQMMDSYQRAQLANFQDNSFKESSREYD